MLVLDRFISTGQGHRTRRTSHEPSPEPLRQETADPLEEKWAALEAVLRRFVGRSDAMNFGQLLPLLEASGLSPLSVVVSPDQILDLQRAIARGTLGLQLIPSDVHFSPLGPAQAQLPRAFAFSGQRFIPDAWALTQVTYDRILWPEEIPGSTLDGKVLRRMCSGLDVAFSVLGNRSTGDLLAHLARTGPEGTAAGTFLRRGRSVHSGAYESPGLGVFWPHIRRLVS